MGGRGGVFIGDHACVRVCVCERRDSLSGGC